MKYHCYTEYMESVESHDVEAETPQEAAQMASEQSHFQQRTQWTVIAGEPVTVDVAVRNVYEAVIAQ